MSATVCEECGGRRLIAEQTGWRVSVVHAFSCSQRAEGDPARCDYSKCRLPLLHDKVVKDGKKTCDTPCRNAAWKERTGYGHQAGRSMPSAPVRTASRKPSGLQVSYRKSVEGCIEALAEVGVLGDEAELIAEKRMRAKLSAKQRARLEESERPAEPDPAPIPLPLPIPHPTPAPPVDPPPAAEETPSVRILQRQRDDNDMLDWVEVDTVETRASAGVALSTWLNEQYPDPLPGTYRAEGNGGSAEANWSAAA